MCNKMSNKRNKRKIIDIFIGDEFSYSFIRLSKMPHLSPTSDVRSADAAIVAGAPKAISIITIIVFVGTGLFIVAVAVGLGVGFGVGLKEPTYHSNKLAAPVVTCAASTTTCGCPTIRPVFSSRIINGDVAVTNSWPWMVYLTMNDQRTCTGFVISDRHVLTAASCVGPQYGYNVTVNLGINAYQSIYGGINITNATILTPISLGDIAVVGLTVNLTFGTTIQPCCLTSSQSVPTVGTAGVIAGWGETSTNTLGSVSPLLRQAVVQVRNSSSCGSQAGNDTICASYDSISACPIDAGGPLMINNNNNLWTCVGIITGRTGTCNNPITFTRIAPYLTAIRNATGYPFNV